MTVAEFIQYATDAIFTIIFLVVIAGAIRRPHHVQIQATLFFGAAFYLLMEALILRHFHLSPAPIVTTLNQIVLVSLSYLLLRLVDSLSEVPPIVTRSGAVGLVLLFLLSLAGLGDQRFSFVLPAIVYFLGFIIYATVIAVGASQRLDGVTKQRLRAVAIGSIFLGLIIFVAGVAVFVPSITGSGTHLANETLALAAGISYYVAFATPLTLRRSWQEPVLRDFFSNAVALPQMAERSDILRQLEDGASGALGGIAASVALWDEEQQHLYFPTNSIGIEFGNPADMIEGAALLSQEICFSSHLGRDYPKCAEVYLKLNANSIVSAPVVSRDRRIGVLSVYLSGIPIFIEDDLALLRLMANQTGVILEGRALVEEETRLRAREEALKLRNDFLASVAHDLKTPLTALVIQAQLLERRARKEPKAPADVDGLHQIIVQTHRLRSFIEDLLDVQRSDDQGIALNYEPCDLSALINEIGQRVCVEPHRFILDSPGDVRLSADRARMTQLFDNLIGNAVKYSPAGGEIHVHVWKTRDEIHASVTDEGIGISEQDLPRVFERHHRGDNAKAQGVHGIGLGLFICRAIVQAHGGTLDVQSSPNHGSTFDVVLPTVPPKLSEPRMGPLPAQADSQRGTVRQMEAPGNPVALGGQPGN